MTGASELHTKGVGSGSGVPERQIQNMSVKYSYQTLAWNPGTGYKQIVRSGTHLLPTFFFFWSRRKEGIYEKRKEKEENNSRLYLVFSWTVLLDQPLTPP